MPTFHVSPPCEDECPQNAKVIRYPAMANLLLSQDFRLCSGEPLRNRRPRRQPPESNSGIEAPRAEQGSLGRPCQATDRACVTLQLRKLPSRYEIPEVDRIPCCPRRNELAIFAENKARY